MAVLRAVDAHRQNQRLRLVRHHAGTIVNFHQRAGHGNPSFRKNNRFLHAVNTGDQRAHSVRVSRIDGIGIRHIGKKTDDAVARDIGVNSKSQAVGNKRRQQRRIEKRGMIGYDKQFFPGRFIVVFQPFDFDFE